MDYKAKVQILSSKGTIAVGDILPTLPAKELAMLKASKLVVATVVDKDEAGQQTSQDQTTQQGGSGDTNSLV
ncbi:hypothetical protein N5853_09365 [Bartonella sp. HY329]|uniref:hypothetical protein n=1 Tax=unclassified Bartonella TaxID=2645622 RepID=UPI0021CA226E|nr:MULTISPECIES: hypothetical protein [unclassified Bartonella]UXM94315.1 hypothetical protein N5853_09365 [Bartonella sp. HY329]UXN08638.1 hypothetical protein N5852_09375 [Bartonella sp. HY328]